MEISKKKYLRTTVLIRGIVVVVALFFFFSFNNSGHFNPGKAEKANCFCGPN